MKRLKFKNLKFLINKGSKNIISSPRICWRAKQNGTRDSSFFEINDSFKKIVITSDTPKPFYNDQGILIMNVYEFLLNTNSLEL